MTWERFEMKMTWDSSGWGFGKPPLDPHNWDTIHNKNHLFFIFLIFEKRSGQNNLKNWFNRPKPTKSMSMGWFDYSFGRKSIFQPKNWIIYRSVSPQNQKSTDIKLLKIYILHILQMTINAVCKTTSFLKRYLEIKNKTFNFP